MNREWAANHFDPNEYERPNQKWICGRAEEGLACPLGPSASGGCRGTCTPYREGDRYYCGNASALGAKCDEGPAASGICGQDPPLCAPVKRGGSWTCTRGQCTQGPLPDGTCSGHFGSCRPVRSVLAKRRIVTSSAFAGCLGVALLLLVLPHRETIIAPGPVTRPHHMVENNCTACHLVGQESSPGDLLHSALARNNVGQAQSRLCLECHQNLGSHAMLPHSQPAEVLAARTRQQGAEPAALEALACAACHHEHRGTQFDLTAMGDRACQTCHAREFTSFSSGHPEFVDYPYARRTRIHFDHNAHMGRHAVESQRRLGIEFSFSCAKCHHRDDSDRYMLVRDFEQTCAQCHREQITSEAGEEFLTLAPPFLDQSALSKAGYDLPSWPRVPRASRGVNGMTRLLLGTQEYDQAAEKLADIDLAALGEASEAELQAVQQFSQAFRRELAQLAESPLEVRRRLRSKLADIASDEEIRKMTIRLSAGVFRDAQDKWFLPGSSENQPPQGQAPSGGSATEDQDPEPTANRGPGPGVENRALERQLGWYVTQAAPGIKYRATGHADPLLKTWLDVSGRFVGTKTGAPETRRAMQQVFRQLSSPFATGRCMKCHTADQTSHGVRIQWRGVQPRETARFTRFDHGPHLRLTEAQGMRGDAVCQACHELDPPENLFGPRWRESFIRTDGQVALEPGRFRSDFRSITREVCASCHHQGGASESCLTCHNYHAPYLGSDGQDISRRNDLLHRAVSSSASQLGR